MPSTYPTGRPKANNLPTFNLPTLNLQPTLRERQKRTTLAKRPRASQQSGTSSIPFNLPTFNLPTFNSNN
ncbi:MAG: hypothetical protein F6K57_31060 [Moorea sp. SIO4A5]|uniref:hypothetical protein n=1 Tax=Moorena sp. SIO4A1 TaxID=2607835 RepID=UPI0013C7A0CB|nr:hypothetical protein [Moorena sp. SIO4A1]NEO23601.1 hypothetical protein [Moorena sp. SIO4A5]